METTERIISSEGKGERIDKYLQTVEPDLSRTRIQELVKDGNITVNGKQVKTNYRLQLEDQLSLTIPDPEPAEIAHENLALDIIYEDDQVLVVNKPRGMVVHPAPGNFHGTLVNGLLYHCNDLSGINGVLRPGIVHRIDKDTSGLLMVAKTDESHQELAKQLKDKTTYRKYLALVHGSLSHEEGTIDAPLGRDEKDRKKMAVTPKNSKEAVTHFKVEERFDHFTFVSCRLETGRTHQIRVHMAYIGHPVVGDPKYGPAKTLPIDGQALHAEQLGFTHPKTGEKMQFTAPLPEDMKELLNQLKNKH